MAKKSIEEISNEYGLQSPFGKNSIFYKSENVTLYEDIVGDLEGVSQTLVTNKPNSANGFYYLKDGTYLGKYGTSANIVITDKRTTKFKDKDDSVGYYLFSNVNHIEISNADLLHFAGAVFGESVLGYGLVIKEEIFAFATTIGNFKTDKNIATYRIALEKLHVRAVGRDNYDNFISEKNRNEKATMKLAIASAINELLGGFDYSYGARFWDGIDIKIAKWAQGLKFTKPEHDIFGIGDNLIEGKEFYKDANGKKTKYLQRKWDHIYDTTVAYSGENTKKANGYYPYYKDDKVNKNKFGTTFMVENPDFSKKIPNKTQTDD